MIKNKFIKLPLFLAGVALIASFLLGMVYSLTESYIADNQKKKQDEVYLRIFDFDAARKANVDHFIDIDLESEALKDAATKYKIGAGKKAVNKSGGLVGFVFTSSSRGYSSEIKVMLAFDTSFAIIGYATMSASDTPSYGGRLEDATEEYLVYQNLVSDGDFSNVVTGASISRNAVIKACNQIATFVEQNKGAL